MSDKTIQFRLRRDVNRGDMGRRGKRREQGLTNIHYEEIKTGIYNI